MSGRRRILIADAVDEKAVALLRDDGFDVEYAPKIAHAELLASVGEYEAIVVRSRSKVSADVLAAGGALRVVGRAGAGVDNIDVEEATRRGIVVMNTPGGNTVSTAEHTIAMMFALARNIPAADRSMRALEWKRAEFTGTEIEGKTLGLIGLGRVGLGVASRAAALGMIVVAYDPLVPEEAARKLGVEPAPLAELYRRADFISVHTPLTPETEGLLDIDAMRSCRRGVRIINCARGGIVNERDLLRALDEGIVAGAALDVYTQEPPNDADLLRHPAVVCTPHLGASTGEAQEKVAIQVARQVSDFLLGRNVAGAVNGEVLAVSMRKEAGPFIDLAEKMGALMCGLGAGAVNAVRLSLNGSIGSIGSIGGTGNTGSTGSVGSPGSLPGDPGQAFLASLLRGFIAPMLQEPVNLVSALALARARGISVAVVPARAGARYPVELAAEFDSPAGTRTIAGAIFGTEDLRIIDLDGFHLDIRPRGDMLVFTNIDRPGMLARVSALLAGRAINIADLSLGRKKPGEEALTVIALDTPVPGDLLREIVKIEGITGVHQFRL
jgi:D-3-phosphoglycerate dehydrogenase